MAENIDNSQSKDLDKTTDPAISEKNNHSAQTSTETTINSDVTKFKMSKFKIFNWIITVIATVQYGVSIIVVIKAK